MGTALCRPLVDSGWNVRLWGTWLDDHLVDAIDAGQPHPHTNVPAAKGITTFRSAQLEDALDGANVVVMAVASVGVPKVTELAAHGIARADAIWLTSKGFWTDPDGRIKLLPDAIRTIAAGQDAKVPPLVAIAGPVKANECGAGMPTATVFSSSDFEVAKKYAGMTSTDSYAIAAANDEVGVELCAPLKNVYAIALGISDGLGEATGTPHHNLKAATFAQAIKELALLCKHLGGHSETAYALAGVGDLEVTGLSGRNKIYGSRIGRGESPEHALQEMDRLEQTVEGVPASGLATKLVEQRAQEIVDQLPLLHCVARILEGDVGDVRSALVAAALPAKG